MRNNKILRTIIGLTLLVALFVPVTALASPNYTYNFTFTDRVNHQEPYHEKGDTEQNWYFTLYSSGSNVSSTNILGVKMNRTEDNYVDVYRIYTGPTSNKCIEYLDYVASDDVMFLGAKKDSDSSSYATLYARGAYNP